MEMHSDPVCRLCLAVEADDKMLSLIPVQELYKKVTNNSLNTNKMPVTVCYICYAQLKRCYKFMVKSTIAENTLIEILNTQTEITPKSVCSINRDAKGLRNPLTVTTVKHENFPSELNVPALVKSEPVKLEGIDIKKEIDEHMTDSLIAEDCGDDSEEDNVPLQCIKNETPDSSNAANIPDLSCDAQVSLPLEVDVEIEEGNHKGPAIKDETNRAVIADANNELLKLLRGGNHECTVCKKRFALYAQLEAHLPTHTAEKPFQCEVCRKGFLRKYHLKMHSMIHSGERPYTCKICNYAFNRSNHLKQHMLRHERQNSNRNSANEDASKNNCEKDLKSHMSKYKGEKQFECDVCNKKFRYKGHLKPHLIIHSGERPYTCKVCNFAFKTSSHLNQHMLRHLAKGDVTINTCEKDLKRHTSKDTGEKHFECDVCQKRFLRKQHLKMHLMIHSGERPYTCEICKYSFNRSNHLKTHMLRHARQNTK